MSYSRKRNLSNGNFYITFEREKFSISYSFKLNKGWKNVCLTDCVVEIAVCFSILLRSVNELTDKIGRDFFNKIKKIVFIKYVSWLTVFGLAKWSRLFIITMGSTCRKICENEVPLKLKTFNSSYITLMYFRKIFTNNSWNNKLIFYFILFILYTFYKCYRNSAWCHSGYIQRK